ncbi:baseplate J/gp47 family protein [Micromonospora chersina]
MSCGCGGGCGCDPLRPPAPEVTNPPGQPALAWRVAPHSHALARMRAALADPGLPAGVRAVAGQDADDPVLALLDAAAVMTDVVSFYTERIAQEAYLRTATELTSVRHLAGMIGYQPRPGVAAAVDIAFDVEDAPGAPTEVDVPAGTPVQSVPGQGELPQTFETGADLRAYAVWNAIPGATAGPQEIDFATDAIWLRGTALGVRAGDGVLVVGAERRRYGRTPAHSRAAADRRRDDERWDFRIVTAVEEGPPGLAGWTRLALAERIGWRRATPLTAEEGVEVHAFATRTNLFGWNAPMAGLLAGNDPPPPGITNGEWDDIGNPFPPGNPHPADVVEVDGDHPRMVPGSWLLLERPDYRELYAVEAADPAGGSRFGVSGRTTRLRVDITENLDTFGRRDTLVRGESRPLPAAERPLVEPVGGRRLTLAATDPPLPAGRRVVVTGFPPGGPPADPLVAAATAPPLAETAVVLACTVAADGRTMTVDLDRDLTLAYDPRGLRVRGNVAPASHGETVVQPLGSGDPTLAFQRMRTRRGPLTHVRDDSPAGARSTLEVRVDGVRWDPVPALDTAGPHDRVHTERLDDEGLATVTTGDGRHGARLPGGVENVVATYRVGVGAAGAVRAGQLSILPRRPYGVRAAANPGPARDWADPEQLDAARSHAPLRIRTLDRAVSVADHEDFAAGFAGVTLARADDVWDGREQVVVVSALGAAAGGGAAPAGPELVAALRAALVAARDPGTRLAVLAGETVPFGLRVDLAHDPAYPRADVEAAVRAALAAAYTPPALGFATGVVASRALVTVRAVPGVRACTLPRLAAPPGAAAVDLLAALPGRFAGTLRPAQVLTLTDLTIGVMS